MKTDEKEKSKEKEKEKNKFWNEDPKISERALTVPSETDDHVSSSEIAEAAKAIEASEDMDLEGLGLIDNGLETKVHLPYDLS